MAGNTTVSTAPAGYSAEIAELIRSSLTPRRMQEKLSSYHENDVASALELLTQTERAKLYQILDSETLAGILEYSDHLTEYVQELSVRKKVDVFSQMEPSDVVEVLRQLEKGERETLVDLLDPQVRSDVKLHLRPGPCIGQRGHVGARPPGCRKRQHQHHLCGGPEGDLLWRH